MISHAGSIAHIVQSNSLLVRSPLGWLVSSPIASHRTSHNRNSFGQTRNPECKSSSQKPVQEACIWCQSSTSTGFADSCSIYIIDLLASENFLLSKSSLIPSRKLSCRQLTSQLLPYLPSIHSFPRYSHLLRVSLLAFLLDPRKGKSGCTGRTIVSLLLLRKSQISNMDHRVA